MVHLLSISLLAILVGFTTAEPFSEQEVLAQPVHTMEGWSWVNCGEIHFEVYKPQAKVLQALNRMSFSWNQ